MKHANEIRKKLGGDHSWMTYAAVSVLSREDQEYLEPESELFIRVYSSFPDINHNCSGEWGGWSGNPNDPRLPDGRREWDVAYYMGWDTHLKQHTWPKKGLCADWPEGRVYLHAIPDSYGASKLYFAKAVGAFRQGRHADGIKFLGILAHYVEDPVTFSDTQALHRSSNLDGWKYINMAGYRPGLLARRMKGAPNRVAARLRKAVNLVRQKGLDARRAIRSNDQKRLRDIVTESDTEGSKALADIIHTAIFLGGARQRWQANPAEVNLADNPSFEIAADDETPAGWFVHYDNLRDHVGAAFYEGRIIRNHCVTHAGNRAVKLMWTSVEGMEWRQRWRSAVRVVPGEKYRCAVWMKTRDATGTNVLAVYFHKRNNELVKAYYNKSLRGSHDWTRCALEVAVPAGAEKARIGLRSAGNRGAVWFDEVEVTRIGRRSRGSISPITGKSSVQAEDLVLSLSFEQKPSVSLSSIKDDSIYGTEHTGVNFPIISCSGGEIVDLHVSRGIIGKCLAFDGRDDFVEIAYRPYQDVLNPIAEWTIAFWMKANCRKDAHLVAKESLRDGKWNGYRVDITQDGRLRFMISSEGNYSAGVCASYPVNRWVHVAATVDRQGIRRLYMDGAIRAQAKGGTRLTPARDKDFYLGADTGIEKFFSGLLDEVRIYRRALDEKEIRALFQQNQA